MYEYGFQNLIDNPKLTRKFCDFTFTFKDVTKISTFSEKTTLCLTILLWSFRLQGTF
jgi:hypothetical protein